MGGIHHRWAASHIDRGTEHILQLGSGCAEFYQGMDMKADAVVATTGSRNP